jgi:hypothetical protein
MQNPEGEITKAKLVAHSAEFWSASETIEKLHKKKLCVAASKKDCKGHIIEAHTIPRSQLAKIAVSGHVSYFRMTPADLLTNNGRATVGERGIGKFSVLNFFCAKHDQELFSHLENDELVFDREQLALLHYRAMAAELYKKMNGLEVARYNVKIIRKKGDPQKLDLMRAFEAGTLLGVRDTSRSFSKCETLLSGQDYARVCGLVVRFKTMPSIMTVGGFSPEFDYDGRLIQRLGRADSTYEQVGLSILAAASRAAVVFTWLADANVCDRFVRSFISKDQNLLTTLAIQTAFEHLENTCMKKNWWDSLLEIERQMLLERMQYAGGSSQERTGACLQYGGVSFDQWDYDSHSFIS